VDATNVYWITQQAVLVTKKEGGGTPTTLATGTYLASLAIDATTVYWTDVMSGSVWRAALDGSGAPTQLIASLNPSALVVDGLNLYYPDGMHGLMKMGIRGGPASLLVPGAAFPQMRLVVDGSHIYFNMPSIGRFGK
jgi:hypothetical protein